MGIRTDLAIELEKQHNFGIEGIRKTEKKNDDVKITEIEILTEKAFGQRRKMIRQSLKSIANIDKACEVAGVDMTMRAEEISPEQYYKIAENI